jgi:hypothetical protein
MVSFVALCLIMDTAQSGSLPRRFCRFCSMPLRRSVGFSRTRQIKAPAFIKVIGGYNFLFNRELWASVSYNFRGLVWCKKHFSIFITQRHEDTKMKL